MSKFRIGTRDSLLAVTQTGQVINELERLTDHQFEMVTMKTTGDLDTSRPLWQMDGKNFFTKELDVALTEGKVDLMVSSYKDIGGDRPAGVCSAAVTERHFSNDILLIKKETVSKLKRKKKIIVGTSSPRRITNITNHLVDYLPCSEDTKIICSTLRGNVNTRIGKLRDGKYDAIVLALAGIERLACTPESHSVLEELLEGLTFMVMPEKTFPSAPAQGSLLLECMSSNSELRSILSTVHHQETADELEVEREHFRSFGGGCHLAVGIFSKNIAGGKLTVLKGEHEGEVINSVRYIHPDDKDATGEVAFLGSPLSSETVDPHFIGDSLHKKTIFAADIAGKEHLFLTSQYGLNSFEGKDYKGVLWVSGAKTFKKAVNLGLWVNGSADSLGEDEIKKLLSSKALKLMGTDASLSVLTSSRAESSVGETLPCYDQSIIDQPEHYEEQLKDIKIFYWTSYPQYVAFTKLYPFIASPDNIHCAGMGKTFREFSSAKIKVLPFLDAINFKLWFLNRGTH
ncbi:MAG: hydroxymethylbilane synthase [Bacteriovoracaceae bacterium]|nr:hydroxymethylbilane synthase [Bacteriovoracaceae bacterium]